MLATDWVTVSSIATAAATLGARARDVRVCPLGEPGGARGGALAARRAAPAADAVALDDFRRLTRDLYIAPAEIGFWQGALRDPSEPVFAQARSAIEAPRPIAVEILYGDVELGRRVISRFGLSPRDDGTWLVTVARHWNVDGAAPR